MQTFLILKLEGVLQAWGGHTFEDSRHSELFPTRSGLIGLFAACLGIDRTDVIQQRALGESIFVTVRIDQEPIKMTDYHTVKDARKNYSGLASNETIQTWRDYLQDAKYTVAVTAIPQPKIELQQIRAALIKPIFTPYLGRRSCPLTRPILSDQVEAENVLAALKQNEPQGGRIYSDEAIKGARQLLIRDVPIPTRKRQFATRTLYLHVSSGES